MIHEVNNDLYLICEEIVAENKNIDQWAEIESSDMFQKGNYEGGFDATEMEFCFSVFLDNCEYWFQISLEQVEKIYLRQLNNIDIRPAEM